MERNEFVVVIAEDEQKNTKHIYIYDSLFNVSIYIFFKNETNHVTARKRWALFARGWWKPTIVR